MKLIHPSRTIIKSQRKMIYKSPLMFHCFIILLAVASTASNNNEPNENQFPRGKPTKGFEANLEAPPSTDPETGVQSKYVGIVRKTGVSGNLYIPRTTNRYQKLPLLIYFHGGDVYAGSAFDSQYRKYSNSLSAKGNVVILSVEYRLSPQYPFPTAYDDSWAALKWVASHSNGRGNEDWLEDYVDFKRVFFAGDGSGANIAHNMAMRVGSDDLDGVDLAGLVLIHPLLWAERPVSERESRGRGVVNRLWRSLCPSSRGLDDPRVNPAMDPRLWSLGCNRVLVCVAGLDPAVKGNYGYVGALRRSGWRGVVETVETNDRKSGFHLDPNFSKSREAVAMLNRVAFFVNPNTA